MKVSDAQTPVFFLPEGPNRFFQGREQELQRLQDQVGRPWGPQEQQKKPGIYVTAVHGLSGMGKTALALELAHRNLHAFDAILWVDMSGSDADIVCQFHRIGQSLGLIADGVGFIGPASPLAYEVKLVRHWLSRPRQQTDVTFTREELEQPGVVADRAASIKRLFENVGLGDPYNQMKTDEHGRLVDRSIARWLMVADHVDHVEKLKYLPSASQYGGAIIVTCRSAALAHKVASDHSAQIHLGPLPEPLGAALLMSRALSETTASTAEGKDLPETATSPTAEEKEKTKAAAAAISRDMGHLPLALDRLGGWLARCGLGGQLSTFVHEHPDFYTDGFLFGWQLQSASMVWWPLSLDEYYPDPDLRVEYGSSLEPTKLLMCFLAVLDPEGVPREFLKQQVNEDSRLGSLGFPWSRAQVGMGRCPLEDPDIFNEAMEWLLERALITVDQTTGRLKLGHPLIRNVLFCTCMDQDRVRCEVFRRLAVRLALCFPRGKPLANTVFSGNADPYVAQVSALVNAYRTRNKHASEVLTVLCAAQGCSWYLYERGRYGEAGTMARTGLELLEEANKKNHPVVQQQSGQALDDSATPARIVLTMVGRFHLILGALEAASPSGQPGNSHCFTAVGITRHMEPQTRGSMHLPALATYFWSFLTTVTAEGHLMEKEMIPEWRGLLESILSPSSKVVFGFEPVPSGQQSTWHNLLSYCLRALGETKAAFQANRRAYADVRWNSKTGTDETDSLEMATVEFLRARIEMCSSQEQDVDMTDARKALARSYAIRAKKLPATHPVMAHTLHQMGAVCERMNDEEEAIKLYSKALSILIALADKGDINPGAVCRTALALAAVHRRKLSGPQGPIAKCQEEIDLHETIASIYHGKITGRAPAAVQEILYYDRFIPAEHR